MLEQGGRNERSEIDDQEAHIRQLEAENRKLRRANEILKGASAFPGGAGAPRALIYRFIDANKERWGVEPICTVLSQSGVRVVPSSYYAARTHSIR